MIKLNFGSKEVVKEYSERQAVNSSMLVAYDNHPLFAKDIWNKTTEPRESKALDIGSAVDCIITRPDDFWDEFVLIDRELSPAMKELVNQYLYLKENTILYTEEELIEKARDISGYQLNWKLDTVIKKFKEETEGILETLENNKGKIVITSEDFQTINSLKTQFFEDKYVKDFLFPEYHQTEVNFQQPIYWEEGNIKFKALLDGVSIIDKGHHEKLLAVPFDIKTYDSTQGKFEVNYFKYKYYYQSTLYMLGMDRYIVDLHKLIIPEMLVFIALDKSLKIPPIMYQMSLEHYRTALNGSKRTNRKIGNKYITGIENLTNYIEKSILEDSWDYPYHIEGTKKIVIIND